MHNTSRSFRYAIAPLLLVGCHIILTGEDPTTSASTGGELDTTAAPAHSSTEPAPSTTMNDTASGSGGATGGGISSSDGTSSSSAADPSTSPTTTSDTSSTSTTTLSDTGDSGSTSDSSTGLDIPCNNPNFECDPNKEDASDCSQDCKWILNCVDDHINEHGGECDIPLNPVLCPDCAAKWCGNGIIDPGEECDKGFTVNGYKKFCSDQCRRNGLFAFVSEETFQGNFNANKRDTSAICDPLAAKNPKLTTMTFAPWLDVANPSGWKRCDDFDKSRPVYLVDEETLVSEHFPPSETLSAFINRNQYGLLVDGNKDHAWSNVNSDGTKIPNGPNCSAEDTLWSNAEKTPRGSVGNIYNTDISWTHTGDRSCYLTARIYCFEQTDKPCIDD